jgi:hypothetical protein
LLFDRLSAPRSIIIKSSDIFGINFNSYNDFLSQIDSLAIDAILLVNRRNYSHTDHPGFDAYDVFSHTYMHTRSFQTVNAAFECYLIQAHDYLPLWKAQIDVKGKRYAGKAILKANMVRKLEKSLVGNGYMVPHR